MKDTIWPNISPLVYTFKISFIASITSGLFFFIADEITNTEVFLYSLFYDLKIL